MDYSMKSMKELEHEVERLLDEMKKTISDFYLFMLEGFKGIYCKCVELPDLEQFKVKILEKLTKMIFSKDIHDVVLRLYRLSSYRKFRTLSFKLRKLRDIQPNDLDIEERIRAANNNREFLYVPEETKEEQSQAAVDTFEPVIQLIRQMAAECNPVKKLKLVKKIFLNIEKCIANMWQRDLASSLSKITIDADCFFPILIYAVVKAGEPAIESHFKIIEEFTSTSTRDGFDYINCALAGCIEHVLDMEPNKRSFVRKFDENNSQKTVEAAAGRQSGSVIDSVASSFVTQPEVSKAAAAHFSEDIQKPLLSLPY